MIIEIIQFCVYHIYTGYSHIQETFKGKWSIAALIQQILQMAMVCKSGVNILELSRMSVTNTITAESHGINHNGLSCMQVI